MKLWERLMWSTLTIWLTAILMFLIVKRNLLFFFDPFFMLIFNVYAFIPILWMTQDGYHEIAKKEKVRAVFLSKPLFLGISVGFLTSFLGLVIPYYRISGLILFLWMINHFCFWILFFTRLKYLKRII